MGDEPPVVEEGPGQLPGRRAAPLLTVLTTGARSLRVAISFLTVLPVRVGSPRGGDYGHSLVWFPLVGLLLGTAPAALAHLLAGGLAPGLLGVLAVASSAWITGGLHLDGVADTFDAAGGGRRDPERMLAIMKDSRIGAHGAVALILVLIAKILATAELAQAGRLWALLLAPAVARFAVSLPIAWVAPARREGLGATFSAEARGAHLLGGASLLLPMLAHWMPVLWPALVCTGITVSSLALWARSRMGGLTGDVYGAAIELGELTVLVVLAGQ